MQTLSSSQASPEVPINENFETLDHVSVYGKAHATTTGLTWGYYGGRWGGYAVAAGTLTLTNAADNYVVAARASGAISVSTATTNWNNTTSYARAYKITTAGSVVTATEDHRAGPAGVHGGASASVVHYIQVAVSDEGTALTAGTAKLTFRMPRALTLSAVRASLTVAQTSGGTLTVDINEAGSSILSTKLTIDNGERTSTTAATAAVISDAALADDAEITIDIDTVGDGTAKGLKVLLVGS